MSRLARRRRTRPAPPSHGLGAVAVIVVLVLLATMAAALLRMGQQTQTLSSQDVQGTRASAAARAGVEWGLYQAFKGGWAGCSSTSQTLDLSADTPGMRVTVNCDSRTFNEGESDVGVPRVLRVYTLDAVACTSASATTACPDAGATLQSGYVERRRQVQAID